MATYPALAEFTSTYSEQTYASPLDRLETYQRVMQAVAENPKKGSSALSSVVDLPRYQIEAWVDDDAMPDVVRGVETARANGWIDVDVTTMRFAALNTLIAGVFSGGSITSDWFVPSFAVDTAGVTSARICDALAKLDAGHKTRAAADSDRATEVLPAADASVLGRVLVALGAPVGQKHDGAAVSLPDYLSDAPADVREGFVQVYLWNRGQRPGNGETVAINESRPRHFRRDLATLVEDVADEPVSVTQGGINLSADAASALRTPSRQHGQ